MGARPAREHVHLTSQSTGGGHGPLLAGYPVGHMRNGRLHKGLLALVVLAACACSSGDPPEENLEVAARGLYAAAFPRDGTLAVAASLTHGASLWDLGTQQRRFDWNHRKDERSAITAVAFSPEGGAALTAEGSTLVLWDARKGEALRFFSAPGDVLSVALTRGGKLALLGLQDGAALLMDMQAGGVKRRFTHDGEVLAVAMDPEGRLALTGSADGSARLWSTVDGVALHRWEHGAPVDVLALSDDATHVFSTARGAAALLRDAGSGQTLAEFDVSSMRQARGEGYSAALFSADGTRLLLGAVDGRVLMWEVSSARLLKRWKLPRGNMTRAAGSRVIALGFSAAGLQVASGDGFIHQLRQP